MAHILIKDAYGFRFDENNNLIVWGKEVPDPHLITILSQDELNRLNANAPATWDGRRLIVGPIPEPVVLPPQPTDLEMTEYRELLEKKNYSRLRANEYFARFPIGDQLEAIWEFLQTVEIPENSKVNVLLDGFAKLKEDLPKPTEDEENRIKELVDKYPLLADVI